jgi:phosphoribosylanthranilate isomerase
MTWVKICGITNLQDALTAVEAGANALGFVFYGKSPRNITPELAREIVDQLPEQVERVGVFVDESLENIRQTVQKVGLSVVQVYSSERSPKRIADLVPLKEGAGSLKLIMASAARTFGGGNLFVAGNKKEMEALYALLLDSGSGSTPGGTGRTFDWIEARSWARNLGVLVPVIVAGGLDSRNVTVAIEICRPWGVDVSSGVEARPRKKDPEKVRAFIAAVRAADKAA